MSGLAYWLGYCVGNLQGRAHVFLLSLRTCQLKAKLRWRTWRLARLKRRKAKLLAALQNKQK